MRLLGRQRIFIAAAFSAIFLSTVTLPAFAATGPAPSAAHHKKHHGHVRHHARAVWVRPQPASFIIDADSGKILEAENADAQRYPASLTKMMTLYLTFEALKKGTLTLNQTIPVSAHAASQPQTNIALAPGDRIAVKDAILSIVVRSANDSAVTLGEALGGSEEAFGRMMSQKARMLGMKHTVFYNASGLPEPRQHTTARDMAILGLSLRKNFPGYFPFFKTETFSYRGITYVTHNHVMTRYEGVDGIKTGYIRASGFNVVTSANHDGHHLIAVVMGGSSWRARDDKMIALLDRTFAQMASQQGSPVKLAHAASRSMASGAKVDGDEQLEGEGDLPGESMKEVQAEAPAGLANVEHWAIQVGVFARPGDATTAANRAMTRAPQELHGALVQVLDEKAAGNVHRAQLANLTHDQALSACQKITALHEPCFSYRVN